MRISEAQMRERKIPGFHWALEQGWGGKAMLFRRALGMSTMKGRG